MSNSVVDRDAQQQKSFGETLVNFETDMKAVCQSLKGHIEEARDNIQATNAAQALDYLIELIEDIESDLPSTEEFGSQQKVLAGYVQEADDYTFSRR